MSSGGGDGAWPGPGDRPLEVFRSSSGRGLTVAWWALSVFALGDLALQGRDHLAFSIGLGIAVTDLLVWLGAWRPAVELHSAHVVLRGSVRDRVVLLGSITAATAVGPLRLRAGDRVFTAASIGSTVRERRRADRTASAVPGRGSSASPFSGMRRFAGLGGPGGSSAGPTSVGFDDSRMDPATREALIGRTAGAHAADRIAEEARRLRARGGAAVELPGGRVSAARFAPTPCVAAALGVIALALLVFA